MTESSGLPPEQEAVRRLLADARHEGPPPPEVVARLDDVLAALVAARTDERTDESTDPRTSAPARSDDSPGRVVDIGSRRRRLAGAGLLAAAAVVVAGVALGQALPRGADDSGNAGAESQSDTSLAESPEAADGAGSGADSGGGAGGASEAAPESLRSSPATPFAGLQRLSSADPDLDARVLALRPDDNAPDGRIAALEALTGCDLPRPGRAASLVGVQVDGRRGVVVYRRPVGEAQGVELYVCGEAEPVRTLTLPAP